MRVLLTLLFIICLGVCTQAQISKSKPQKKIIAIKTISVAKTTINLQRKTAIIIARLYIDKNDKINKELSFFTDRNKAKPV